MLKKLVWELFATISGTNFKKEYAEAVNLKSQAFLKNLLFHAYNNVPYYHDVLRKAGAVKDGKACLANFEKIPILTKEIIRRRTDELKSRDYKKRKWFYNTSGGSTGEPVKLIQDRLSTKWSMATNCYYYNDIIGIDELFAKKILLWGARRDIFGGGIELNKVIDNALTNTVFLDCLSMTETDMRYFVRIINSYRPEIIRGYASSLFELCKFVKRKKLSIHSPKVVVSSAETLYGIMRKKLESVFGTKVYDFYGSREVHGIAGECKYGLLHMFMFNNYVEVLDRYNQRVKEGENGRIIVTTLHNFSMPLVRYEIGDIAVLGPQKCKCGCPLPTLKKVTGRRIDYFVREDGRIIYGGYFIELFWGKDWVKAFKLIQEDYKRLRILVVLRDGIAYENQKREIEEKMKLVMGKDCKLKWEVVDEISKTKTGKYLHVESLLQE